MHQRQRSFHQRVVQVGEVLVELRREQHALVDDGARGKADYVPVLGARERRGANLVVGALADHVELALERQVVVDVGAAGDEHLPHERLAGARSLAEHAVVGRHSAPAEHGQAFRLHDLLELLLDLATDRRVARQEDDAAAVLAGRGQRDTRLAAHFFIEGMRHLQQHPCAVARVDFAAAGPAVVQVLQYLDRLLEDAVRLVPLDVDDEPLAASVVLVARVVETLPGGRSQLHGLVAADAIDRIRRRGNRLLCAHRRPCLWFSGVAQGQGVAAARAEPARLNLSTVVDTSLI